MTEYLKHYITRSIKSVYRRKLFSPIIYLILLLVLWIALPLSSILFPTKISDSDSLDALYQDNDQYIRTTLTDLHFTGYTQTLFGHTSGYYYYTMRDDTCTMVLLSPRSSEEGLPEIKHITVNAKLVRSNASFHELLTKIASDLHWTTTGITEKVSPYTINEPGFRRVPSMILIVVFAVTGIYAVISILLCIIYYFFPVLSPPCQQLALFGKPSELLAQAEEELATLPQLATEDMFITEHYFIAIASSGIAIVPIQEIIWIYKHSTLHKLFWYHFSISYTLHITANKHLYIQCPKNLKSDIDGIMDYLAEANHNILVGFSEQNRLKVQQIQGKPLQFEKLISLLKKRI